MALPPRDQRHQYLRFEGLEYTDVDILDFEERLGKIYGRGVHRVHVFDFWGLTDLMVRGLSDRILIEQRDAQGQIIFTSRAWSSSWAESARQILDKGNLSAYWRGISFKGDFLGTTPFYTMIRDLMLRLRFASRRKRGAMISRGIICNELNDTWAWVAPRPERQPNAAAGALEVIKGALDIDEGS
ncbi:hypothetical protein Tco_0105029 [Tanacetum coccineum]